MRVRVIGGELGCLLRWRRNSRLRPPLPAAVNRRCHHEGNRNETLHFYQMPMGIGRTVALRTSVGRTNAWNKNPNIDPSVRVRRLSSSTVP